MAENDHPPDDTDTPRTWRPAARVVAFVAAAVLVGLAIWVGGIAFAMAGPVGTAVVLFVLALLLAGGGLVLAVVAALGPSDAPRGEAALEWTAERQGLPTDPEAYQDGGLAVAMTTTTVPEADAAAAYLNACGVPAWVDQGYASTTLSHLQYAMNPSGVRVMVPLGRLADARRALAEHAPQGEEEEDEDGHEAGEEDLETGEPGSKAPSSPKRSLAKRGISAMLLLMGITVFVFIPHTLGGFTVVGGPIAAAVGTAIWGLFGLGLCVAGVRGLLRR